MTAIVISRMSGKNIAYAVPIPKDMEDYIDLYDPGVLLAPAHRDYALEHVFRETNHVDGNEFISREYLRVPSTSVGDLVIIEGRYFLCHSIGWTEITVAEAIEIQKGGVL